MPKLLLLLLIGLAFEAIGVIYLSRGLKEIGPLPELTAASIFKMAGRGATNGRLILGVALEAIFFAILLVLISKADVSLVWPLTSLGFVATTLAARFMLHENVSAVRWVGVLMITLGAGLVSWSEKNPAPIPTIAQRDISKP